MMARTCLWPVLASLLCPGSALAITWGDRIEAECSFVNTGEIASGVTITIECRKALEVDLAPLLEDLDEAHDERVQLSKELGATEKMVEMALVLLGEKNVPPEKRAERLVETIQQQNEAIRSLRSEVRGDDTDLDRLKTAAADAIEAGEPARADRLLAELEEKEENLKLEEQLLAAASTKAERGRIALSELRYLDAARHFDGAANKAPRSSHETYLDYLSQAATAYYRQGDEFGDNDAITEAIERFRGLLDHYPRDRVPLNWAWAQMNLGTALSILGERESGTERLEQAVDAYQAALQENTRERVPFQWAATQMNLGNTLSSLGERESDTERLEQAVDAYQAALQENTRERVPLQWAATQMNLGTTLRFLGERKRHYPILAAVQNPNEWIPDVEQAIAAYQAALEERTRERVPLRWAATQMSLSNLLVDLGIQKNSLDLLHTALEAKKGAYEVMVLDAAMEQRGPQLRNDIRGLEKSLKLLKEGKFFK